MAEHRIIPRDEWGAKYLGGWGVRPLPATEAWLHRPAMYSPLDADATLEEDTAYVRRVEEVGYARFGPHNGTTWDEAAGIGAGISYTYLVMRSGRIFAGHEPHRESSHTAGHNRPGIGIAWADGIDAQAEPTVEQINATAWLLREAVRLDVLTAPAFDGGHRDVYPTSCPTDAAYKYLGTVNNLAATGEIMAKRRPTHADMLAIETDFRSRGLSIYCGPSDWKAGRCAPGKHSHSADSRHFKGLALDFGYGTAPVNDTEALIVEVLMDELDRHPTLMFRKLWNVGPGNHEDHGHVDDMAGQWTSVVNPRRGVRVRDGVDLFVPVKVAPNHKPVINKGFTLAYVQDVQSRLTRLGHYTGKLDGYRGQQTTAAITAFQKDAGLTADGLPGPATLTAIKAALAPKPDPYAGFTADHIRSVQTMLKVLGFYTDTVDGLPGPNTQAAIRAFQTKYRLEVDGLPGPNTTATLERAYAAATAPAPKPEPPVVEPDKPAPPPVPADPSSLLDIEALTDAIAARLKITRS